MKERYIIGPVEAQAQTDKAFCCNFNWSDRGDDYAIAAKDCWIPLSQIDESCHDDIEEACRGDIIEIAVTAWWLEQNF